MKSTIQLFHRWYNIEFKVTIDIHHYLGFSNITFYDIHRFKFRLLISLELGFEKEILCLDTSFLHEDAPFLQEDYVHCSALDQTSVDCVCTGLFLASVCYSFDLFAHP